MTIFISTWQESVKLVSGGDGLHLSFHHLEVTRYLGAQKITFIVDIGAAVSIIPKDYLTNTILYPMNILLISANNVKIECSR